MTEQNFQQELKNVDNKIDITHAKINENNSSHLDEDFNKELGDDNHNIPLADEIFNNNPDQIKIALNIQSEESVVSTKLTKEKKKS